MANLFEPVKIGSIEAKNRVFMAPLTRARSTVDHVPTDIMIQYYSERADAGLIFTEATGISREGLGWPYAPGIWSDEQVAAWKPIVKAVHDKGGKIALQLWHMGRAVHSEVSGLQPVSASETTYPTALHVNDGKREPEKARALTKEDIARITREYAAATKNALAAGFDGVHIHAANGYLIDQFLKDSSNLRTDEYGGSVANRVRILDEVVAAVVNVAGPERTGVRFSPNGDSLGVIDSDPEPVFTAATEVLNKHKVAWLELREPNTESEFAGFGGTQQKKLHDPIRKLFKGKLILNQEYTRAEGDEAIGSGVADAITFGRPFIFHPDFVERLRENKPIVPLNAHVRWWFSRGPEGYTDWSHCQTDEKN